MFWLWLGCTGGKYDTASQRTWIELSSFRISELDSDLFPAHQPDAIECPANGFRIELNQLEVQTDICNYALIEWNTQYAVPANTTLEALILHTGLWAPEAGNAHFALGINGELFWEGEPPIPSDTDFFFEERVWAEAIPSGSVVQLHLHNHGANDWKLGYFQPVD